MRSNRTTRPALIALLFLAGLLALAVAPSAIAQDAPIHLVRISGGVAAANLLNTVDPVYPPIAKAAHVEGTVVLHAIIGEDGTVRKLAVISGPNMLQSAAVDAVRHWTYKPYLLNGEPVEVETTITVNFHLAPVAQVSSSPVKLSPDDAAANIISRPAPVYPPEAKQKGIQGAVVLHAIIGKDGTIRHLSVISGPPELQASAVDAVKQWRYRPYLTPDYEPAEVETDITVNYVLTD